MEQRLHASENGRKTEKFTLKKAFLGVALFIPALIVFISIMQIGYVSANDSQADNNDYNDGEHPAETLGLGEIYHTEHYDHPFGLNAVTIITPEGTKTHFTEKCLVSEIVEEAELQFDGDDVILPDLSEIVATGADITLIRMRNKNVDEIVSIPFETVYEDDPTIDQGIQEVAQYGVEGEKLLSYLEKYENGKLVSKDLISEKTLSEPTNTLIKVGTRKPIPHSTLQTGTCDSWDVEIDKLTTDEEERNWLKGLMRCESGCNAGRVSYNGSYHGLFQFHPKTFAAYGGTDIYDGHQQLPIVLNWVRAGVQYTQFPACSRGH